MPMFGSPAMSSFFRIHNVFGTKQREDTGCAVAEDQSKVSKETPSSACRDSNVEPANCQDSLTDEWVM